MCIRDRHGKHPSLEYQRLHVALLQTEFATVQANSEMCVPVGNTLRPQEHFSMKGYTFFCYYLTPNIRAWGDIAIFLSNIYSSRRIQLATPPQAVTVSLHNH